ncbi:MAG: hypothetical protein PHC84_01335 [Clostridia bacterium]|nr:hypothetical protein [Clostridia bacterium]
MKKILKKQTVIAIIIIATLAVAFGALLAVYLVENRENREIYEEQKIRVLVGERLLGEYTYDELSALSTEEEFRAVYKPSGKPAIERSYSGIALKKLLQAMQIDVSDMQYVSFKASDGRQMLYTAADVLEDGNVYIANKVEGEYFNKGIDPLAYNKPQEDGGPYVVIKANDSVSQNRVKLLVEICVT